MERLTHKTDMGWDAWEEILYSVSYDPEGVYNILDLANEYGIEGQEDCAEILKSISVRLKAYEDTGLEPCEIPVLLDRLKHASEQWNIWCDAYQKDVPVWIPVAERIPAENEYRVVCAAHSGKPFLRRFEVAYITDTVGYQFGYYDGYKWIDKSNKEIPNVVAWKNHEPFNPQN